MSMMYPSPYGSYFTPYAGYGSMYGSSYPNVPTQQTPPSVPSMQTSATNVYAYGQSPIPSGQSSRQVNPSTYANKATPGTMSTNSTTNIGGA